MKRLLIIDGKKNLLLLYKSEFEAEGYRVDVLQDPRDLEELTMWQHYDLVIIETWGLKRQRLEALTELLGRYGNPPVIVNTTSAVWKPEPANWSPAGYMLKSSDLTELKNMAENILREMAFASYEADRRF